eukprot:TRINITY_DN13880_c0_g1_i1.p1 TRINITY_DN13880_c0_g1~~TRINITY_DN13880_c0_g1_i1.p1  ORF type:complete len:214 (+),score=66.14 TRINITY_DN13880_c0_g1_i1:104-745(+)
MQAITNFFFGKEPTPEEMVKKWRREISAEGRTIDRTIRGIEREENKLKLEIKKAAKASDMKTAKTLAKEIVHSRKHKDRLYISKAQLNSVSLHLQQNLATYKMAGHIAKSAEVMKSMNNLIRLPELNNVMMTMSREMEKAGLIEEMMDDILDEDDMDEEVDEEVDKVVDELILDIVDRTPAAKSKVPAAKVQQPAHEEKDLELEKRYEALNDI